MKNIRSIFIFLAAAVFACTSLGAQDTIRVACVGNSITQGAGIKNRGEDSYPSVLQKLLGDGYLVGNFGIGGHTLLNKGDRPYREHKNFQRSLDFNPDIVVIKLGTNDSKPMNWDDHAGEFENDLRELVEVYKNLPTKPKVYLCFPIWVVNDDMTIRESVIASEIIPAISKVARETGVSVIDLHTTLYGMPHLIPDGVHPNELGYIMIARDVYDRIR